MHALDQHLNNRSLFATVCAKLSLAKLLSEDTQINQALTIGGQCKVGRCTLHCLHIRKLSKVSEASHLNSLVLVRLWQVGGGMMSSAVNHEQIAKLTYPVHNVLPMSNQPSLWIYG